MVVLIPILLLFGLLCVIHLLGSFFCTLGWIRSVQGEKLLSGLLSLVLIYALVFSGGTTVFIGALGIGLFYFLYRKRAKITQTSPSFKFNLKELIVPFALAIFWLGISFLVLPTSGSGEVIHHDFLYYIDISWALDRTGVESLVNDPINSIELTPNGYHFFIPWLLSLTNRVSFGLVSYDVLIHVVMPLLFVVVHLLSVDFVRDFSGKKSKYDFLLATIPFCVFPLFLPVYDSIALMQDGSNYSYGMLNSFWSGKLLVSMLIFVPLFNALLKTDLNKAKLLLAIVCFLSIIHVPVVLIALMLVSGYSYVLNRERKTLLLDLGLIVFLLLYFQLFYGKSSFIPLPKMGENVADFVLNLRTSLILMAEALIQMGVVYAPIIILGIIFHLRLKPSVKLKSIFILTILVVMASAFVWILFKSGFGSSEFFKLAGNLWIHMFIAAVAMIFVIRAIELKKPIWIAALACTILLPTVWAFSTNYTLTGSHYSQEMYSKLEKESLDDQLLLNFETEDEAFVNLPGQLNPFVHYQLDVLYQTHDRFVVISGSNLFSDQFAVHSKDKMYGNMIQHDPIYRNWVAANKPEKDAYLANLLNKWKIQYVISDGNYVLPPEIQKRKKSEIRNKEKNELLIKLEL